MKLSAISDRIIGAYMDAIAGPLDDRALEANSLAVAVFWRLLFWASLAVLLIAVALLPALAFFLLLGALSWLAGAYANAVLWIAVSVLIVAFVWRAESNSRKPQD